MIVRLVLWSLADSMTNVGELRRYLAEEAVDAFDELQATVSVASELARLGLRLE